MRATSATSERSKRRVILGGVAILVAGLCVFLLVRHHHVTKLPVVATRSDGGAAIHAPTKPGLPVNGVQLTGVIVDGAGLPVVGATIEAELEKGAPDRALATATADA